MSVIANPIESRASVISNIAIAYCILNYLILQNLCCSVTKMPIFSGGFSPKKATPRKVKLPIAVESCPARLKHLGLGLDIDKIDVKLGGVTSTFHDGHWSYDFPGNETAANREIAHLRSKNERLEKEKNMLRVKNEILIDTVTLKNIRIQEMEVELRELNEVLNKSPLRFVDNGKN